MHADCFRFRQWGFLNSVAIGFLRDLKVCAGDRLRLVSFYVFNWVEKMMLQCTNLMWKIVMAKCVFF